MEDSPLSIQLRQAYNVSDKDLTQIIRLFETLHVRKN